MAKFCFLCDECKPLSLAHIMRAIKCNNDQLRSIIDSISELKLEVRHNNLRLITSINDNLDPINASLDKLESKLNNSKTRLDPTPVPANVSKELNNILDLLLLIDLKLEPTQKVNNDLDVKSYLAQGSMAVNSISKDMVKFDQRMDEILTGMECINKQSDGSKESINVVADEIRYLYSKLDNNVPTFNNKSILDEILAINNEPSPDPDLTVSESITTSEAVYIDNIPSTQSSSPSINVSNSPFISNSTTTTSSPPSSSSSIAPEIVSAPKTHPASLSHPPSVSSISSPHSSSSSSDVLTAPVIVSAAKPLPASLTKPASVSSLSSSCEPHATVACSDPVSSATSPNRPGPPPDSTIVKYLIKGLPRSIDVHWLSNWFSSNYN